MLHIQNVSCINLNLFLKNLQNLKYCCFSFLGEVHHALNLSKPKVVFASKTTVERISKVAKNNAFVKQIIVFSTASENPQVHAFKDLMENKSIPSNATYDFVQANKNEDVALIVCSSGTTGLPKGVQLTQSNILSTLDSQL